ncbi:MAG: DVU_1555 family C-GCAxxG-C-C protein [Desulfobacterales bacterium]
MIDDVTLRLLHFSQKGYGCSQILMRLLLEARGEDNPALVRAMAGLAYGCGGGRATCGTLTGGCCALALYAGKGQDGEDSSERLMLMLQELSDWFAERVGGPHGGISCETIVGEEGPAATRQRCGAIVADTYAKVLEILAANGFDPSGA